MPWRYVDRAMSALVIRLRSLRACRHTQMSERSGFDRCSEPRPCGRTGRRKRRYQCVTLGAPPVRAHPRFDVQFLRLLRTQQVPERIAPMNAQVDACTAFTFMNESFIKVKAVRLNRSQTSKLYSRTESRREGEAKVHPSGGTRCGSEAKVHPKPSITASSAPGTHPKRGSRRERARRDPPHRRPGRRRFSHLCPQQPISSPRTTRAPRRQRRPRRWCGAAGSRRGRRA